VFVDDEEEGAHHILSYLQKSWIDYVIAQQYVSRSKLSTSNTDANLAVVQSLSQTWAGKFSIARRRKEVEFQTGYVHRDDQEAVEERRQLAAVRSSCVYFSSAPN